MIRIGRIVATHGLQGSLILTHKAGNSKWLQVGQPLFIELHKESFIPFFVAQHRATSEDEYILQVEDVDTVEAARKLIAKNVYVNEDVLSAFVTDSPLLWIGFNMVDKTVGALGTIDDVYQAGVQWLARVIYKEKEVLVPLVPQIILDVNMRNRFVRVDLPEGLLEVYLGKG
ncbi:MAG: 16S rRNA processing protein RimM [Taibaiella sp.]|nr:16S rRNA processing protein RimM [Taibaiella sp.]